MDTINYILLFSTMLLCLFLIVKNKKSQGLYFSPFLVIGLLCLYALGHSVLIFNGPEVVFAILFNNFSPLFYLIGPLIYWYTQNVLADKHCFELKCLLHFIPFVLFSILTLPYILTSFDYKIEVAHQLMQDFSFLHSLQLVEAIPSTLNVIFRPVHLIAYCIMSFVHIHTFMQHPEEGKSLYIRQVNKVKQSLYFLIAIVLFNLLIYYILILAGFNLGSALLHTTWVKYLCIPATLALLSLSIYYVLHPEITLGIPRPITRKTREQSLFSIFDPENEQELMRLFTTADQYTRSHWNKQLVACHTVELNQLSRLLQIPEHHLKFCQHFGVEGR